MVVLYLTKGYQSRSLNKIPVHDNLFWRGGGRVGGELYNRPTPVSLGVGRGDSERSKVKRENVRGKKDKENKGKMDTKGKF